MRWGDNWDILIGIYLSNTLNLGVLKKMVRIKLVPEGILSRFLYQKIGYPLAIKPDNGKTTTTYSWFCYKDLHSSGISNCPLWLPKGKERFSERENGKSTISNVGLSSVSLWLTGWTWWTYHGKLRLLGGTSHYWWLNPLKYLNIAWYVQSISYSYHHF